MPRQNSFASPKHRLFLWCLFLLILPAACNTYAAGPQLLPGHVPTATARLRSLGRLPGSNSLDLVISLPLRNPEALTNLLQDLYNPASPNYHHYLTAEQFAERFAPTEADYQAVITFARAHGLTVTGTHPNRTLIDVRGPVTAIENTFHLHLQTYRHPTEARTFYAPDAEPSLDLTVPALAVNGLDNYFMPRPMNFRRGSFHQFSASAADANSGAVPYSTGSGPRGTFLGKDFRAAYAPGVTLTGAGQSVGLFELDGYFPSDIATYEQLAGLPNVPLTNVFVDTTGLFVGSNNGEVALDIDMAIDMAPGLARVIVYEGRSSLPNDVLNRMATDNAARQLSSSWGFGAQVDPAREQIYQQFAAQGQTMFQASGDLGAWTGPIFPPSDDALLTIVGGTSLTTSSNGQWLSETTWPGSGGGISTSYPIPVWQQNLNMSANHGSTAFRNIPDVACLADTVIWLVANHGQEGSIGGTSAAAPLWAGFAALANQQAAASSKPPLGFLNPTLSTIGQSPSYATALHDIVTGNNVNSSSPSLFFAVPGFDLCTGWGTPAGSNLITALISPPDALLVIPPAGFTSVGGVGGPFNPSSQNLSLTTIGATPINWAVSSGAPWLNVSPTNGTVTSNALVTVNFALNSAASNLPPGTYTAVALFTNLNDGFVQSRQFTLDVITPPVILVQPTNLTLPAGSLATFTVQAATNAQLFYQWRENGTNLIDAGNISGSTTSSLAVANISSNDAGTYSVIVSNALGFMPSSNAVLTVIPVTSPGITFSSLYSFTGGADGANPNGLIQATNGIFYGTTQSGGAGLSGTVFQFLPGGVPSVFHAFTGVSDGSHPQDALVQASDGSFYGTTFDGGATDNGTIFKVTTNGGFNTLVTFNITNGDLPYAGLTHGSDGNFYGVTYQGGVNAYGSAFVMTPGGQLTTLYSFADGNDGGLLRGGLVQGADGNFYGTTFQGGASSDGTVFKIATNGVLTTLLAFNGTNGGFPEAALAQDENGILYGVTSGGGASNNGIIFAITTAGAFTNLHAFTGGSDGAHPAGGLLLGADGNLYGTATFGGAYGDGTVFRLSRDGTYSNLLQFDGGNGANPSATLTQGADGSLYGTTQNGGASGAGTIFQLATSGPLQILTEPASQTVYSGSRTVFSVVTAGTEPMTFQWAANGTNLTDGGNISGSTSRVLTISNTSITNVAIYSVTVHNPGGVAFSTGATLQVLVSPPVITTQPVGQTLSPGATAIFAVSAIGSQPLTYQWQETMTNASFQNPGNLASNPVNLTDGGNISGSTTSTLTISNVLEANGGVYSVLVGNPITSISSASVPLNVVPVSAAGTRFSTLHTFAGGNDGSSPSGMILGSDGNLYGTTRFGGPQHAGSVFIVTPGGLVTNVVYFGVLTGFGPDSGVAQGPDGNFYGTTQFGGTNATGNVFILTPARTNFFTTTNGLLGSFISSTLASVYSFTGGVDGNSPVAPLIRGADGGLYGSTQFGGNFGRGNIFRISTNGSFANLYSFTGGQDDSFPTNALMQAADGNFYGVTQLGGTHGLGSVFRLTPSGNFSTVYSFTGVADGKYPNGPLVQGPDGSLYGTTKHSTFHGFEFYGVYFKVTTSGAFTTLYTLNAGDGHYPAAGLILANDGNYYGTAEFGGGIGTDAGNVFFVAPNGTTASLVNFDGFDEGAHPEMPMTQGIDGNLYGTTSSGGPGGHGNIFRLALTAAPQITTPPAAQTVYLGSTVNLTVSAIGAPALQYQWLLNSTNLANAGNLSGSTNGILTITNAALTNAGLYSVIVTNALGGITSAPVQLTVISSGPSIISPPSPQTVLPGALATFTVTAAGNQPLFYQWQFNQNNLNNNGRISGATTAALTISNVSPADAGGYSVIVSNALGSVPSASALLTVTTVTAPGATLDRVYSFTGGNDGANPNGLALATNGILYGTALNGGSNGLGTVFQVSTNLIASAFYSFTGGNDGGNPAAALAPGANGSFFGTASTGGSGFGTVFKMSNGVVNGIYSFNGASDGSIPLAALAPGLDGNFYGTASASGSNNLGTIFKTTPGGSLTGLYSFTGSSDGGQPQCTLARGNDGSFYGAVPVGGSNGFGGIFKITTNGVLSNLYSFTGAGDGAAPNGLVLGLDGNFYGTAAGGGSNGNGSVFRIATNGLFTPLHSFGALVNSTNADGANPSAALALGTDGNFYGSTLNGGNLGSGTLFKMTPAGVLTTLAWFDGLNGAHPAAALTLGADGAFYGATAQGGPGGVGAIFRLGTALPPFLVLPARTNGNFVFVWNAVPGLAYQVQSSTNLASTNWSNVGSSFTASNSVIITTDPIGANPRRFYRVMLLP